MDTFYSFIYLYIFIYSEMVNNMCISKPQNNFSKTPIHNERPNSKFDGIF